MAVLSPDELTFAEACAFLQRSSHEFAALRKQGLVACVRKATDTGDRQTYSRQSLMLTGRLTAIGERRNWAAETLAWYADLAFASEIGRAVLLPLMDQSEPAPTAMPNSWLEMPYVGIVLRDLEGHEQALDENLAALIRSLLTVALGTERFWEDETAIRRSPLAPILRHLEEKGHVLIVNGHGAPPDTGQSLALLVLAFATLAPPISRELRQIVQETYAKLRGAPAPSVPLEEQERILREELVAVDKLYATKATEIHSAFGHMDVGLGMMTARKRTIALQLKLPMNVTGENGDALDNILDIIRPYLGTYGARVVQALYEIANDPPYWRSPIVTLNTNDLLDRLGEKRDVRGIHYSRNRARMRDTLNAAHNLEIVGEYTTWEDGVQVRKAFRRPVVSMIGATFDAAETSDLTTEELFLKGLPKNVQIRLNFYDGVRRPNGALGSQYVLMPRLAEPKALPKANYSTTHERLRQYLLLCRRASGEDRNEISLSRETALEKAGITNKNVTRATQTLEKALNRLVEEGILASYTPLPRRSHGTFLCVLAERNGVG